MQLKLWKNFSKRKNSTKRPADASATVLDVKLKQATSIEKPVFILQSNEYEYNYAYALGHYYFINDIVSISNDLIEIHCSQDLLATYKSEVQATTAFVEYSTSLYNEHINDPRIVTLNTSTFHSLTGATALFDNTGYYLVSAVGRGQYNCPGFARYYVLTAAELSGLSATLMNAGDSVLESLAKRFTSPYDAIISCKWLPFDRSTIVESRGTATDNIQLGDFGTGRSGYVIENPAPFQAVTNFGLSTTMELIQPYFKRVAPYSKMTAFLPYFGNIELPILPFLKDNAISFNYGIDFITGDVVVNICTSNTNEIIASYNYNVAVDCPVAQVSDNSGSILSAVGSIATNAALMGVTGGSAATLGVAAGVVNAGMETITRQPSIKGSISGRSFMMNGTNTIIDIETLDTIHPDTLLNVQGRSYMQVTSLSNLIGYVKTANASVSMGGLGNDRDELNRLLDAGIYIE